ncbi:MAG: hypothetical protein ABI629_17925 [bacterium]
MRRLRHTLLIAAVLIAHAAAGHAAWVVDADGACVERWASSDMLRGPKAIANAPLLPFRSLAGGAEYAWNTTEWWPYQIGILGPAVTLFSGAFGVLESAWWIGTGLADTLTGGYFTLAPVAATQLSIEPKVPTVVADVPAKTAAEDPCGRPR